MSKQTKKRRPHLVELLFPAPGVLVAEPDEVFRELALAVTITAMWVFQHNPGALKPFSVYLDHTIRLFEKLAARNEASGSSPEASRD